MHAGRAASGDGQSSPRFTISRSCVIIGTFGLFGTAVFVQKIVLPAQIAPDEAIYLTYFSYSFGAGTERAPRLPHPRTSWGLSAFFA